MNSLECPSFDVQEEAWRQVLENINKEKLESLLASINHDLIKFEIIPLLEGRIHRLCVIDAKSKSDEDEEKLEKRFILRVFNPHKFLEKLRCRNEVSIITHLRKTTSIPVPEILSFSYDKSESILGCEYILFKTIKGVQLSQITMK